MGRKIKPDFMKKSEDVSIRMTKQEIKMLMELCDKKKMTVSEFIRYLIRNEFYNRS